MIHNCTYSLTTGLPGYPGDEETLRILSVTDDHVFSSSIHMSAHFGTHVDTPKHFFPKKAGLANWFPEESFTTSLWLFCEPSKRGFSLAPSIDIWSLPSVDWIFFYTGWSDHWGTEQYYSDFIGLEPALVEDLLDLNLTGLGIDAPSIDPVPDEKYSNHNLWLDNDRYILENLKYPEQVNDGQRYQTVIAPLPINEAEASPCRVFHVEL